jgi:hypothetical protein
MKKQAHHVLIDYFKDKIPQITKEAFDRRRQTDNVVIWVTGLSTGAIALIFSQAANMFFVSDAILKITVLFFLCAIIAGVVFRAFIYSLEQTESDLIFGFEGYCYGVSCDMHGPIEINENYSIEQIADRLKEDMGLDYDEWLKNNHLNQKFWIDHYNRWAEFWRKSEKDGLEDLGRAIAPLFLKNSEETKDVFLKKHDNTAIIKKAKNLLMICNIAYLCMLISFGLAIVTISCSFIFS